MSPAGPTILSISSMKTTPVSSHPLRGRLDHACRSRPACAPLPGSGCAAPRATETRRGGGAGRGCCRGSPGSCSAHLLRLIPGMNSSTCRTAQVVRVRSRSRPSRFQLLLRPAAGQAALAAAGRRRSCLRRHAGATSFSPLRCRRPFAGRRPGRRGAASGAAGPALLGMLLDQQVERGARWRGARPVRLHLAPASRHAPCHRDLGQVADDPLDIAARHSRLR